MDKGVNVGTFLILFIGIIVVLAIIPAIATQTGIMTSKSTVTNETLDKSSAWLATGYNSSVTLTLANPPSGWKTSKCPIAGFVWANSTVYFAETTDYTFSASTGVITIVPTAAQNKSGNNTVISYNWCRDGYETDSGTRTIVSLILIFAALALVVFTIHYAVEHWF